MPKNVQTTTHLHSLHILARLCSKSRLQHYVNQELPDVQTGFRIGFLGSSAGKEPACNAGDPSLIPGSGRSTEGIGYPLQYSWASLVPQLVKNLPAMRETWVRSLGWEDPLEEDVTTHSSILIWSQS